MGLWSLILAGIGVVVLGVMFYRSVSSEDSSEPAEVFTELVQNEVKPNDCSVDFEEEPTSREQKEQDSQFLADTPLEKDFPHRGYLENAGISTYEELEKYREYRKPEEKSLTDIHQIGPSRAEDIRNALNF